MYKKQCNVGEMGGLQVLLLEHGINNSWPHSSHKPAITGLDREEKTQSVHQCFQDSSLNIVEQYVLF